MVSGPKLYVGIDESGIGLAVNRRRQGYAPGQSWSCPVRG